MPPNSSWSFHGVSWKVIALLVLLVIVILVCILAIALYFILSDVRPGGSILGVYAKSAVVTAPFCSKIPRDILAAGGNAVDAAIAALLCDGVCAMHLIGVGGGFVMTIYNKTTGEAHSLVARETAPGKATQDMFVGKTEDSLFGAKAAAVPGQLKGFQEAYRKFGGGVPWKALFEPTIKLCEEGFPVTQTLSKAFKDPNELTTKSDTFKATMFNSSNGEMPEEGDIVKFPLLAKTLRVVANSPKMAEELYNGSLTEQFVADIQAGGGIITVEDMNNYSVQWKSPYKATLSGGLTAYSSALPGSGILLVFILRLLDGSFQAASSEIERSQMIIEAFKHAYGHRTHLCDDDSPSNKTQLEEAINTLTNQESILSIRKKINVSRTSNDPSYYGADYEEGGKGTDNIVVVAQDGAVAATGTLNLYFGSKYVSTSTGIVLNNQMDDFSTPGLVNAFGLRPSSANYIRPGKRPLSSMAPTIVVDSKGDVRLAIGAAGGSKITSQTTLVAIRNLWQGMNIKEAIDERRFHHQLVPMRVQHEPGIPEEMVKAWEDIGHKTQEVKGWPLAFLAVVTGVARRGDDLTASYDFRRLGETSGE